MGLETKADETKSAMESAKSTPPAPPPPPRRRSWSVTRREIDRFWRKKRLLEEEHFLAAIKAAARLRASRLSEEDYLLFLEENDIQEQGNENKPDTHQEIRVGIKDWWTKSKYAYLNQPAVGSGRVSRRSNYIPNKFYFCNYKYSPAAQAPAPAPAHASAQANAPAQAHAPALPPCLGVF